MLKEMRFTPKIVLNFLGNLLALSSISFVIYHLYGYSSQVNFTNFTVFVWGVVILFTFIYGLSNIILAFAWLKLLTYFGEKPQTYWALQTYSTSQLAKYLPGNVFHFASRQALGVTAGISGKALLKSVIWELGLISICGLLFFCLILPLLNAHFTVPIAFGLFIVSVVIILGLTDHYLNSKIWPILAMYGSFLFISGLLFCGLFKFIPHVYCAIESIPWYCLLLIGAYVVAWLIGLVVPGAPAGAGIRELVLLFLLRGQVDQASLLMMMVLGRMVTVGGDLFFFLLFFVLRKFPQNGQRVKL